MELNGGGHKPAGCSVLPLAVLRGVCWSCKWANAGYEQRLNELPANCKDRVRALDVRCLTVL